VAQDAGFGALLRRCRQRAGLSQEELAARAFVSTRAISDLERGVNMRPRRHTALALADGLGLDGAERAAFEGHAGAATEPEAPVVPLRARPPLTLDTFVDHDSSVDEVLSLVSDPRNRVVTLLGPGGVGKTRLALEVARRLEAPVAFVGLASLTDPALVVPTIVDVMEIEHGPTRSHAQSLVEHLSPLTLTLVLDNVEQVVDSAAEVVALVRACPGLTVVTTSRVPLRVSGEVRYVVRPLPAGSGSVEHRPAVRLFLERAGTPAGSEAADLATIGELCARLDGLPLAIELAAARARVVAPDEMLRHLDQVLDLLGRGRSDAPTQHQSMRAALEWSFRLLRPPTQDAFAAFGVFAGSAAPDAAETVWGLPPGSQPAFYDLLETLVEAHLLGLEPIGPAQGNRITVFETTRQFALEKLAQSGGAELAHRRLTGWVLDLVDRAETGLVGPDQLHWLAVLDTELPNVRAVGRRLALEESADSVDAGLRLASALQRYWEIRCSWDEGAAWLTDALARPGGDVVHRAKAHKALGVMYRCLGELERAAPEHERAVELYASAGDELGVARCLNNMGVLHMDLLEIDTSIPLYQRSLEICEGGADRRLEAIVLSNLGLALLEAGRLREALRLCRRSSDLFGHLGNVATMCWADDNMATTLTRAGHPRLALRIHHESARRLLRLGDDNGFCWSLEAQVEAWTELGQTELAGRALGFVSTLRERLGAAPVPLLTALTARRSDALAVRIGSARFDELWHEGTQLEPDLARGWFAD
jgi:predicted ATPase/DNA-binding XRE family transcriptional regulator